MYVSNDLDFKKLPVKLAKAKEKKAAMDELIKKLLQGEIFWHETSATAAPPVIRSAFVPYPNATRTELGFENVASGYNNGANSGNMSKKMIGFLRKSWPTMMTGTKDNEKEKERCFRHMMNERMRREKQKKSYFALHSMLPHGTKNDKNSILQTATRRVQELEWLKKDLETKNYKLKANLAANNNEGLTKIRVKIDNPKSSGIDSMLEVLKCSKELDSNPRMIQSKFTNQQFLAALDFETEMEAAKVEKAINMTLQEIERTVQER